VHKSGIRILQQRITNERSFAYIALSIILAAFTVFISKDIFSV
jgi:hypothetical protein